MSLPAKGQHYLQATGLTCLGENNATLIGMKKKKERICTPT